eukprot:gb/GECG01009297.1/.p1 GENE.gb/GECG01009297.1/~~gb/GECG01009297.1/.p1  ORF type:complete len:355 (+),score=35.71 gb/GECG01009297.1/:1-1065(+)
MAAATMESARKRARTNSDCLGDDSVSADADGSLHPGESDSTSTRSTQRNRDRLTHNLSERRRSRNQRHQIDRLGTILARAGKVIKRDKNSVLESTVDYVQELEEKLASVTGASQQNHHVHQSSNGTLSLRGSENNGGINYRRILHASGVAQLIVSPDYSILDCNEVFCSFAQHSREALLNRSILSIAPEEDKCRTRTNLQNLVAYSRTNDLRNSYVTHKSRKTHTVNGERMQLVVTTSLLCDSSGKPEHFVSTIVPIPLASMSTSSDSHTEANSVDPPCLEWGNASDINASQNVASPSLGSIGSVSISRSDDGHDTAGRFLLDEEADTCHGDLSPARSVDSGVHLGTHFPDYCS